MSGGYKRTLILPVNRLGGVLYLTIVRPPSYPVESCLKARKEEDQSIVMIGPEQDDNRTMRLVVHIAVPQMEEQAIAGGRATVAT